MPKFYLQTASDDSLSRTFRGQQPAHDHNAAIKFSQKIRALWKASFAREPRLGTFQSNQSNPAADYTLRWNSGISGWEQT